MIDPTLSALEQVESWLAQVIVGEGFCPFAAQPHRKGTIDMQVVNGTGEEIGATLHSMLEGMQASDTPETALLVLPKGYNDLATYLDLYYELELLTEVRFEGKFVLASFHPAHRFADVEPGSVVNWIHRSPVPVIHVLRSSSLDRAEETYPDIDALLARNREHAEKLGEKFFARVGQV